MKVQEPLNPCMIKEFGMRSAGALPFELQPDEWGLALGMWVDVETKGLLGHVKIEARGDQANAEGAVLRGTFDLAAERAADGSTHIGIVGGTEREAGAALELMRPEDRARTADSRSNTARAQPSEPAL
jgi:hypothetical protein